MQQAIFSYGCLGLWPFLELDHVLQVDLSDEMEVLLLQERDLGNLSQLFKDPSVFGDNEDSNVFRRTAFYYSETLAESRKALVELQDSRSLTEPEGLEKLICVILSSSLVFGFLACHPHRVVPLVSFPEEDQDPKTDVLGVVCGVKRMVLESLHSLRKSDVGDLFHKDEFDIAPSKKVIIVNELRNQLNEHYKAIQFFDFHHQDGDDIAVLNEALDMLAKSISHCKKFNYPVALFRWLFAVPVEFGDLVRKKNWFALRLLFVYCCLCLYCRFYIHRQCIWRDYVKWFHQEFQPLSEFDRRLFDYVITQDKLVKKDNYLYLSKFDIWSAEFDY